MRPCGIWVLLLAYRNNISNVHDPWVSCSLALSSTHCIILCFILYLALFTSVSDNYVLIVRITVWKTDAHYFYSFFFIHNSSLFRDFLVIRLLFHSAFKWQLHWIFLMNAVINILVFECLHHPAVIAKFIITVIVFFPLLILQYHFYLHFPLKGKFWVFLNLMYFPWMQPLWFCVSCKFSSLHLHSSNSQKDIYCTKPWTSGKAAQAYNIFPNGHDFYMNRCVNKRNTETSCL